MDSPDRSPVTITLHIVIGGDAKGTDGIEIDAPSKDACTDCPIRTFWELPD